MSIDHFPNDIELSPPALSTRRAIHSVIACLYKSVEMPLVIQCLRYYVFSKCVEMPTLLCLGWHMICKRNLLVSRIHKPCYSSSRAHILHTVSQNERHHGLQNFPSSYHSPSWLQRLDMIAIKSTQLSNSAYYLTVKCTQLAHQ
ncbi:hypothetical protein V6N11_049365 [Hibiscus sabdariffa]|uniref:Uncharacterized protein n=1 Tax=Hibiscus sabdariffa TaxID=183260 RepID=A0ABR2P0R9_9ROSI